MNIAPVISTLFFSELRDLFARGLSYRKFHTPERMCGSFERASRYHPDSATYNEVTVVYGYSLNPGDLTQNLIEWFGHSVLFPVGQHYQPDTVTFLLAFGDRC